MTADLLQELFQDRRPTRWVTRERPKIDRIACPWLIRRFIDPGAEFLYVPTGDVFEVAERERAVAFDIPGAPFSHEGERCSFDSFLAKFGLEDEGLAILAPIIRGAGTTSRLKPLAFMRSHWDWRRSTMTITPCWRRVLFFTTLSMPGRPRPLENGTIGSR